MKRHFPSSFCPSSVRWRYHTTFVIGFLLLFLMGNATTAQAQATVDLTQTYMNGTDQIIFIDATPGGSSPELLGFYVSYQITNTSVTDDISDLYVTIDGFSSTGTLVIELAPNGASQVILGALNKGSTTTAFFFLKAASATTDSQSHVIKVYDGDPDSGGTLLNGPSGETFTIDEAKDTLDTNTNTVNSVSISPNPAVVDDVLTITVEGETGQSGAACAASACTLTFTPAAFESWPANALKLISTSIAFTSGGLDETTLTNDLYHEETSSFSNSEYTATYMFEVIATTSTSTAVSPVGYIHSGGPLKHTNTNNFDTFDEINNLLPVELTAFDAVLDGRNALLTWETASETNNAGFDVQHRYVDDATAAFEAITFVEGHGTTEQPQTYSYRIDDLAPGRHAFRLKQIDFDGTFEYSPELEVIVEMVERFVIEPAYPNPFNSGTQFRFAVQREQQVRVDLYDMLGRRVKVLYEGQPPAGQMHTVRIDGSTLPSGLYVVYMLGKTFAGTQQVMLLK